MSKPPPDGAARGTAPFREPVESPLEPGRNQRRTAALEHAEHSLLTRCRRCYSPGGFFFYAAFAVQTSAVLCLPGDARAASVRATFFLPLACWGPTSWEPRFLGGTGPVERLTPSGASSNRVFLAGSGRSSFTRTA